MGQAMKDRIYGSARVTFDTRDYVTSNGKEPHGDGAWAFCTIKPGSGDYLDHCIWVRGSYAAAKREVTKIALNRGIALLYVCA